jgi:hypothetical protein
MPVIILGAGLIGLLGGMYLPDKFMVITEKEGDSEDSYVQYQQLVKRVYDKRDPTTFGPDVTFGGHLVHAGISVMLHY